MKIDASTDLKQILESKKVTDILDATYSEIETAILSRVQALTGCMTSGKLSNQNILLGQTPIYDKANQICGDYSEYLGTISETFNEMSNLSINKEYDELMELRAAIDEKLQNDVDPNVEYYKGLMDNYNQKTEEERLVLQLTPDMYKSYRDNYDKYDILKKDLEKKRAEVDVRVGKLDLSVVKQSKKSKQTSQEDKKSKKKKQSEDKAAYYNQIPSFEIGKDGKPTTIPPDFQIDSHHRLNTPGIGIFIEASGGDVLEFHYDPKTNMFYYSSVGQDWDKFDYASQKMYAVSPEDMLDSSVDGGIMFF